MTAFTKHGSFKHRNEVVVDLRLAGRDKPVQATVFVTIGERASDLMNDARAFIPVRFANGETMIIAKTQITSISEGAFNDTAEDTSPDKSWLHGEDFSSSPKPKKKPASSFDAYAALRVSPSATTEEIRSAYKARIKAVHPDRLSAFDLDDEIAKAAVLATQKVNYAYQKIMRERGAQEKTV